jgi:hypothetical protein
LCWKVAEARFILKRALLLCGRKIAVTCHPLRQVLLVPPSAILSRDLGRTRSRASCLPCYAHGRRLGRNHRRCCRQQQGGENRSYNAPQVSLKCHDGQPEDRPHTLQNPVLLQQLTAFCPSLKRYLPVPSTF